MISSFLGMNVDLGIIGESEYSFVIVCLVSCLLSVFIAIWLKKRKYVIIKLIQFILEVLWKNLLLQL